MAPTRVISTRTLDFDEPRGPIRYAILSHRWIDEEVSFQEWSQRQTRSDIAERKGYKKIRSFCREARGDGFDYAWVDTICIDKANFSELSEAINSMFGWYRDAAACYVYLHDLGYDRSDYSQSKRLPDLFEQDGSKCEWFYRGWTLQELLAPTDMRFYAQDWSFIGLKENLYKTLSKFTGIDEKYLTTPGQIFEASISQRMSWISRRQTTKSEDIAYSLIGVFDINMPLLYGEGGIKAFRRLQEEILKVSTDQTIFAWEWPRGWDAGTHDWVTLFAPTPTAFQNSGGYTPDDRLWDETNSIYSMSNLGLSISLQIVPSCSSLDTTSRNLPAPSKLVYGGLNCVTYVDNDISHETGALGMRSLVAIPLLKQGNRYFRAAFPSMPVPIKHLWMVEPTKIYVPRLRDVGSDVRESIGTSIKVRDKLEMRYFISIFSSDDEHWEMGESISTPFWTKFEDLSSYISIVGRPRNDIEAIIVGIKYPRHIGSQFFLYLALSGMRGRDLVHCHVEEAGDSNRPTERNLRKWVRSLDGSWGNEEKGSSAGKVNIEGLITMPNGTRFIPVRFAKIRSISGPREIAPPAPEGSAAADVVGVAGL